MFKPLQLLQTLRRSLGRALRAWSDRLLDARASRQRRDEDAVAGDDLASGPSRDGPPAHWVALLRGEEPAADDGADQEPDDAGDPRGIAIHYQADYRASRPAGSRPTPPASGRARAQALIPRAIPASDGAGAQRGLADGDERGRPDTAAPALRTPDGTPAPRAAPTPRPAAGPAPARVDAGRPPARRHGDDKPGSETSTGVGLRRTAAATPGDSVTRRQGREARREDRERPDAGEHAVPQSRPESAGAAPAGPVAAPADQPSAGKSSRAVEFSTTPQAAVPAATDVPETRPTAAAPAPPADRSAGPARGTGVFRRLVELAARLAGSREAQAPDGRRPPPPNGPRTATQAHAAAREESIPERSDAKPGPVIAAPAAPAAPARKPAGPRAQLSVDFTPAPAAAAQWPGLGEDDEIDADQLWPSLPADAIRPAASGAPGVASSRAAIARAHRDRLEREQRGESWNA